VKILICDDDQVITSQIRFKLEKENIGELFIAKDGYHALNLMKTHIFDLLITDIHMPHHNGDEIMKVLQERTNRTIPIIMMSSDGEEEVKLLAKKQGVKHFLTKPFNLAEMVTLVKRISAGSR
jgi:DNA-binding response OmpR family regulator